MPDCSQVGLRTRLANHACSPFRLISTGAYHSLTDCRLVTSIYGKNKANRLMWSWQKFVYHFTNHTLPVPLGLAWLRLHFSSVLCMEACHSHSFANFKIPKVPPFCTSVGLTTTKYEMKKAPTNSGVAGNVNWGLASLRFHFPIVPSPFFPSLFSPPYPSHSLFLSFFPLPLPCLLLDDGPLKSNWRVWGSAASFLDGVWGEALTEIKFNAL